MRKTMVLGLFILGLLAGMASLRALSAPPALRSANPAGSFDAVRAKDRLAVVLGTQAPHPADTAANDAVRDRLITELRAIGLQPRVADRFTCNSVRSQRGVACTRTRNVVAAMGPPSGRHLLINSHYDSVPVGPGASDAGVGVAAMLEVARLLKDRPLARPVTFLFNEGEESGLIGARAFLDGDPLSGQVDSLINLEARGTTGPVNMFETSLPNAAAVKLFAASARAPVASGLAVSAYRQIPNSTDVTVFAEDRRWLTLNFAPIGNETRYHSPGDDLAAMDLATLQHMGDQTLAVAAKLASAPAPAEQAGEWLFMTMPLAGLVILPIWAGLAAACVTGALLIVAVVRRRAFLPLILMLLALLVSVALAWAGLALVGLLREGQFWRAYPQASEVAVYAGVVAAGLAALALFPRIETERWRAAFWLLFLLLGALLTAFASGALIYFLLPPAIFALGLLLRHLWKGAETAATLLAALVAWLSLGAMLGLLQDLLNGGPLWLFAAFGSLLLFPWLIEAKPLIEPRLPRRFAGLALLAWLPAAIAPAYSADRQQQWSLQYVVDPASRQPVWSVVNDRNALPSSWRRFGDWRFGTLPFSPRGRWIAPAPVVAGLTPARLIPTERLASPGGRLARLRIEANGSNALELSMPSDADVRGLGVPGQLRRPAKSGSGRYRLTCTGRSCDGQVVDLLLGPKPVELLLVDTRWSLPPAAAPLKAAQPANARAQYVPDSTVLVSRLKV